MIKLAFKDLKLFFKDKRSVVLTFAIPIALITLFAFAFGGIGRKSNRKINLQLTDLDQTEASKAAILLFDSLPGIELEQKGLEEAEKNIMKGKKSFVLIIHKGFSDSIMKGNNLPLELKYDAAQEMEMGMLQQSLIPTIATLPFNVGNPKAAIANKLMGIVANSDSNTKNNIEQQSNHLFDMVANGVQNEKKNTTKVNPQAVDFFGSNIKMTSVIDSSKNNNIGLIQAIAGTAVMMLLFSVVGIGMGLLDEKHEGTLKRLMYIPFKHENILFGKMIAANVISILQLSVMFVFAWLAFGLNIKEYLFALVLTILATSFACSAFGVLLAAIAKNRHQVQGLSTLIILVMSAIGGSMIPLFIMPEMMQKMAVLSVNYWSIQSFYDIFWRNLPLTSMDYIFRILILLAIGLILNIIAVLAFKKNILRIS